MIFSKETKERFVKMLEAKQIIVINSRKSAKTNVSDLKIIGADQFGRWDFTPLVASMVECKTNNSTSQKFLTIRGNDAVDFIYKTLGELKKEGICEGTTEGDYGYFAIEEKLCTFYL